MKKFVLILLFGISLFSFNACSNIEPIIQDVCEITTDICNYANILCSQFNPEAMTKSEQEQIKSELLKIKETLQAKVNELNLQAELKKNDKEKIYYLVERLKSSVNQVTNKVNEIEIVTN